MIRITAKKEGFRRCGIAHSKEPTEYPDDRFSNEELSALEAESQLIVEIVEDKAAAAKKAEAEAKKKAAAEAKKKAAAEAKKKSEAKK